MWGHNWGGVRWNESSIHKRTSIWSEHLHRRKDGTNFFGKSTGQPIFDQNGEVSQYFAMIEDITETKNADYRRIESETDFLSSC
jgi:PAS domain S-box-containing protein